MATKNVDAFDRWIRGSFVEMNTELEELYFAREERHLVDGVGDSIKDTLVAEGKVYIIDLLSEGNTDEGFENTYDLLGSVGLYMAACRRHDVTEPSRETTSPLVEASALALNIATTLGVSPRFATAHLTTNNQAVNGVYRSFTSLKDEFLFLDYNFLGVLAYMRVADALRRILPLGVSHPITYHLLGDAKAALEDVIKSNDRLFAELDSDRFFFCVRPYYKPYRVGPNVYRGANAGDFAGINVIDLLLGLCSADNPSYSQILMDKFLFMLPEEQAMIKDCMRRKSLMNLFSRSDAGAQSASLVQAQSHLVSGGSASPRGNCRAASRSVGQEIYRKTLDPAARRRPDEYYCQRPAAAGFARFSCALARSSPRC